MIVIYDLSSETGKMNILTKDGFLLFKEWYDRVRWFSGIAGTFLVKQNERWYILDIEGNCLNELRYNQVYVTDNNLILGMRMDGKYDLICPEYSIIGEKIDSVMWADRGIWGMNIFNQGGVTHYFNGEGGDLLAYAHNILISNENSILIGKCGNWFYYDGSNHNFPIFRYPN